MADRIAGIVQEYAGKPINVDHGQEEFYNEFDILFKQAIPDSKKGDLEARIKNLPGFSIQELLLSNERATYFQAFFAVDDVLGKLITYSRSMYIRSRLDGLLPEVAFKDSMGDIEHLREAVQSGEITEDFKFLVQRHLEQLDERIWSYCGELWERK